MNKKVLITVSGGIPSVYSDPGVDAVIVDFDDVYEDADDHSGLDPIHNQFLPLMKLAQVSNAWPVSDDGRKNDAYYMAPSESDLEVTLCFKPMD